MKKLLITSILLTCLSLSAFGAEKNKEPKLLIKSGIGLSETNTIGEPVKNDVPVADPVKWKDETKFSKQPKTAAAQEQTKPSEIDEPKCYYVTSQVTNIRSTPSFMADRIGIYKYGSLVCERNRIGEWIYTGSGWINTKFLSDKNPLENAAKTADSAEKTAPENVKPVQQETAKVVEKKEEPQQKAKEEPVKQETVQQTKPVVRIVEKPTIYMYVSGENVNIRVNPDKSAEAVGKYEKNEKVRITDSVAGWAKTDRGWVSGEFLSYNPVKAAKAEQKIIKCMYVSYKKANIRKSPDKHSKHLGDYDNGDKVCLYEISKGWGRSDKGWVYLHNLDDMKCFIVDSKTLNVRKKPDSDSKILKVLGKGSKVCEYDRKNGWVNIGNGWVSGTYLD